MEEFKIVEYKKADGNINVFYHIFSGKLIFISGNQELVNAIIQRNKSTDLLFEIDGLKHNITNFVKNLIPATNKNIAEIKKKIPIKTDVAIFSAMLDSSIYSFNEWTKPPMKRADFMHTIKSNSISFESYIISSLNK